MGVTLERVQNKFACIIGELCSEPLILSQFAIWVDLRIAEYKAKGAISLECTGDEPDPSWLKGHKSESPESPPERGTTTEEVPGWNPKGSIPTETLEERLSPVVVKEEPLHIDEADVFPLSLHRATAQKRRSCDSVVSEGRDFASPSRPNFKQRRTLPPSASATQSDSSDNQTESLMSIIQGKSSESVEGVTSDSQGAVEISLIDDNSEDYSELMNDTNSDITSMLISPSTSLPSSDATNQDIALSDGTRGQLMDPPGDDVLLSDSMELSVPEINSLDDHRGVNIGYMKRPLFVDCFKFSRLQSLPTAHLYILGLMDLVFTNEEMATSSYGGGIVKTKGCTYHKKRLSPEKLSIIYQQAAKKYKLDLRELFADPCIRNAINSKCRGKKYRVR